MHTRLDALLDPADFRVLDPAAFHARHTWYLHTSTAQWACALAYALLALASWRAEDRAAGAVAAVETEPAAGEVARREQGERIMRTT